MSGNIRRHQRRAVSVKRTHQKTWLRRYLRTLKNGVAAASIGGFCMCDRHPERTGLGGDEDLDWKHVG